MTDRIPNAPGRCKAVVTSEELQKMQSGEEFAITLRRDDNPIVEGTPYNKASVLPDELAARLCPGLSDPMLKDALYTLQEQKADVGRKETGSPITMADSASAPLLGLRIFGKDNVDENLEPHPVGEKGNVIVKVAGKNIADIYGFSANSITRPTSNRAISNSYGTTLSTTDKADTLVVTQSSIRDNRPENYGNGYFCIGFFSDLKQGDIVTVSFDVEITNNLSDNDRIVIMPNGKSAYGASITTGRFKNTVTWDVVDAKKYLEIRNNGKSMIISNFQVEYGGTATDYETFKEPQTITVPTPGGLLGNDVDYDEINFAKGVLIRRCLEQSETPLPLHVMEDFSALKTYTPTTRISNDENAKMEVNYYTLNTSLPIQQKPECAGMFLFVDESGFVRPMRYDYANAGQFLMIDPNGLAIPSSLPNADIIIETGNEGGWRYKKYESGFAELCLVDKSVAGTYPGAMDPLFTLPFPMSSESMVQVTIAGKAFFTDYQFESGTDLRIFIEGPNGEVAMLVKSIHIFVTGYMEQ